MARISFRQGILRHQTDTSNNMQFLQLKGTYVDLYVSPDPTIITFVHGDTDYLYTDSVTVQKAWGPFTTQTAWLYWDLDLLTGAITRGFTELEPVESPAQPQSPQQGQMWFNTQTKKWQLFSGAGWRECARVFAARLSNGVTFHSMSINGPSKFTGTQVGLTTGTRAGSVVYTHTGHAVRANGRLFTTEDQFLTGVPTGASLRVANIVISGKASTNLSAYHVVQYDDFNTVSAANPLKQGFRLFGLIEEDAVVGEVVNFVTEGLVFNEEWDWISQGAGANDSVYINGTGEIVLHPIYPNSAPVGLVVGRQEIFFSPQMYPDIDIELGATPAQQVQLNANTLAIAGKLSSVQPGDNIFIDNTDPTSPIIHADVPIDPQIELSKNEISELRRVVLPFSFNGVLPDDKIIARFITPFKLTLRADENHMGYSPTGVLEDPYLALIELRKNEDIVGVFVWQAEMNNPDIFLFEDVVFSAGDILSLGTTSLSKMESPTISIVLEREAVVSTEPDPYGPEFY